jgi:hypothetical protein
VFAIIISSSSYLHFVSYAMMLASFCVIGPDWRRLSSCIVFWVWSGVSLVVGSIGYVVVALPAALDGAFAGALAAGLAGALAAALAAGLTGCTTSFSPHPSRQLG